MKKIIILLVGIYLLSGHKSLFAQTNFYDVDSIREIKLYFDQPNWDYILDSLYVEGNEERLVATSIIIDGTQLDSVGVRYKGYSSVSVNRKKNPFNIKLDYINNQNYNNIEKIKLSNVIQDPSFLREVLSYEIARKYMPASLANYTNLYINDTLWGVYSNIEAVDDEFLQKHFGSSDNTLFKCNPENLDLYGENSNLNNSLGTDSTSYYPYYALKSDNGWADLYNLIDTLNTYTDSIENILNVDRTLWMHAFNYALINFDSYVGYAQNYYLYKDNNGRFNPILWDLNQSFASYRLADASIHYNGFTIAEAKTMDPLLHYNNVSVLPRPLMRNLFNNDRYRKMYLAHMRTIMEENFDNQDYVARATAMYNLIDVHVQNDTNKFYTYADYQNNLTSTVSDLVDYPGITDLMDARSTYLNNYPGFQGSPNISNITSSPINLSIGDSVWINVKVTNASAVILAYRFSNSDLFTKVDMIDDGNHYDGIAGDSIYGFKIENIGHTVEYYLYAENDSSGRFSPARAAYEYYELNIEGSVVLNELCATNSSIWTDEQGQYEDWIELYNNTSSPISLNGYYMSDDNLDLTKWMFPDTTIAPYGFLIVWADKDVLDPGLHADFKLSAGGESVYLSDSFGNLIDEISFGTQTDGNITYGRIPNGIGPWEYVNSSFNDVNLWPVGIEEVVITKESDFIVYPNPASGTVTLKVDMVGDYQITLRDLNGREVIQKNMDKSSEKVTFNISNVSSGFYIISLSSNDFILSKKFIIK
jgi:spore coat protein CotH